MRRIVGGIAVLAGLLIAAPAGPAISAEPGELDGFEYVSLGDSYAAGFGLIPFSATSPFAATPPITSNGCYQGDANYPHLVAADLGLALTDRTCSGAVSPNLGFVAGASLTLPPVGSLTLLPQLTTASQAQTTMSGASYPGLQVDALGPTTDVVTVAIGGNDLGFSDIAESCMRASVGGGSTALGMMVIAGISVANCKDVYESSNPSYADYQLATRQTDFITPRIAAVFDEIATKAPNAQVFVVGYPQIAPADATDACFSGGFPPFSDGVPFSGVDLGYIHDVESELVAALQSEAAARGFHFVDTWEATAQHTICAGAESWIQKLDIENAVSGACSDPDWLPLGYHGTTYFCMRLGALHPTADGVAKLRELTTAAVNAAFGTSVSVGSVPPGAGLTVDGVGFRPGEPVEVVLHSTPVSLGTFTADASGAFSAAVTVPADVPVGAHTVVSTGQTSGRAFSAALTVELAATGSSDSTMPLLLALCFVTAGFLLISARRARPSGPAR